MPQPESPNAPEDEAASADRRWRRLWLGAVLAVAVILAPTLVNLYALRSAREAGDLPRALRAARDLSDGFFGPLLNPWLEEVSRQIREEIVADNLQSIQRLVPDTEESAYAEMELGRLALSRGDARQAVLHLERYLKSGLGRDLDRARVDLSEAYREVKRHADAESMLKIVWKDSTEAEIRAEAAFRLGELYQFHLNRPRDAMTVYRDALADTGVKGRWRNDILTNVSLMKE